LVYVALFKIALVKVALVKVVLIETGESRSWQHIFNMDGR